MTAGILTVVLTTAAVNADAAGRSNAGTIPACNAAGTAHIGGEEALARAFGKPAPEDLDDIRVCKDGDFLRIVPEPLGSDLERDMFRLNRSVFCLLQISNNAGLVLLTETTPENEAADRKKAVLYAETIKASPQLQHVVNYVNTTYGENTASDHTVSFLWVGDKNTLNGQSHKICGTFGGKLWNITASRKQIAEAVNKIVEGYILKLVQGDLITMEEYDQLSRRLANTLDAPSP